MGVETSNTCAHTITRGSGATLEKFCTTTNGNLIQVAWNGVEQVDEGFISAGYVLCVGGAVKAHDLADGGEAGFQAPVTTEPGGANTLPLTITRKTTDNSLLFTQVYTDGLDSVTVTASLKNLTGSDDPHDQVLPLERHRRLGRVPERLDAVAGRDRGQR